MLKEYGQYDQIVYDHCLEVAEHLDFADKNGKEDDLQLRARESDKGEEEFLKLFLERSGESVLAKDEARTILLAVTVLKDAEKLKQLSIVTLGQVVKTLEPAITKNRASAVGREVFLTNTALNQL